MPKALCLGADRRDTKDETLGIPLLTKKHRGCRYLTLPQTKKILGKEEDLLSQRVTRDCNLFT